MAPINKFEEYKFFAESTHQLSDRRQRTTEVYVGVNTAIFALIAFLLKDAGLKGIQSALVTLPLFVVGVCACFGWYKLIRLYQRLIAWRFEQLMELESDLSGVHQMYSREFADLFAQHTPGALSFSTLEAWMPITFIGLYVICGGLLLLAKMHAS